MHSRCPAALFLSVSLCRAAALDVPALERELAQVAARVDGRLGACVTDGIRFACVRADERFSMQSVMKLLVGAAVLRAVDQQRWTLDEKITLRREDLSLYVQPLSALVGPHGFTTSVGDLVRRAIIESDSAATDFLIRKLGGPPAVQQSLEAMTIRGIRLDRDERHLQTEIAGLRWRPELVDAKVLDEEIARLPDHVRAEAFRRYQKDVRDTVTPRGMADFLMRLRAGKLLSSSSTAFVLQAMAECATFPDRLKAGVPDGWQVAHKTGTSGSWEGVTAATNDVGILTSRAGTHLAVAVFLADSKASSRERAAAIARVSAAAVRHYN